MKSVSNRQWEDFRSRYQNCHCSFCNSKSLDFLNPNEGNVADIEIVAVSCYKCGHVELFNADYVRSIADEIDAEYHKVGMR